MSEHAENDTAKEQQHQEQQHQEEQQEQQHQEEQQEEQQEEHQEEQQEEQQPPSPSDRPRTEPSPFIAPGKTRRVTIDQAAIDRPPKQTSRAGAQTRRSAWDLGQLTAPRTKTWGESLHSALILLLDAYRYALLLSVCSMAGLVLILIPPWFSSQKTKLFLDVYIGIFYAADIALLYGTVYGYISLTFGWGIVKPVAFRVGIPCMCVNTVLVMVWYFTGIQILAILYYASFVAFLLFTLRSIAKTPAPYSPSLHHLKEYLITKDGTPAALLLGSLIFTVFYGVFNHLVYPIYESSNLISKIIIRSFVVPSVFGFVSSCQSLFFSGKSLDMMEKRMMQSYAINFAHTIIGRMLSSDAGSMFETFVVVLTNGVMDIIKRSIYAIYFDEIQKFRHIIWLKFAKRNPTRPSFSDVAENMETGSFREDRISSYASTSASTSASTFAPSSPPEADAISTVDLKIYYIHFRGHQYIYNIMSEFQALTMIPIILFICKPLSPFLRFNAISTVDQMVFSIVVQFVVEIIVDIISTTIQVKRVGFDHTTQVVKSPKYTLIRIFILVSATMHCVNLFLKYNAKND